AENEFPFSFGLDGLDWNRVPFGIRNGPVPCRQRVQFKPDGFFPDTALTIEYMHKPGLVTRPIRLSQHVLNDAITCPDGYTCPIRYFLCPGFLAFHLVVRDNPAVVVLCEREISPGFVKFRAPPWTPGIHACTGGQLFSHRNRIFRLADLLGQFLQYVRSPYQANLNVFLAEFPDFRRFRNGDVFEIPGPGDVM